LSIPITAAATATIVRNGNITRVSDTVSSNLPGILANELANSEVMGQAKSTPSRTMTPVAIIRALMTRLAEPPRGVAPLVVSVRVKVGTNAALIAPSANRSRTMFGCGTRCCTRPSCRPPEQERQHLVANQAEEPASSWSRRR